MIRTRHNKPGFTIVELLVVIVVIAILAAITIVSYTGVTQRANLASTQYNLSNASKKAKLYQIENNTYPIDKNAAIAAGLIPSANQAEYAYQVNNISNPQVFCVTHTKENDTTNIYSINQNSTLLPYPYCPALYLDAGNTNSYPGSGTTWYDLSGNGNNGTLINGPTYSSSGGGSIVFDGTDDYVNAGSSTSLDTESAGTISMWVYAPSSFSGLFSRSNGGSWSNERLVIHFHNTTGKIDSSFSNGTSYQRCIGDTVLPIGQWLNLTVAFNGTNAYHYINGQRDKIFTMLYTPEVTGIKTWIGRVEGLSLPYFAGNVSEVQIYNVTLSDTEVDNNFDLHRSRYGI